MASMGHPLGLTREEQPGADLGSRKRSTMKASLAVVFFAAAALAQNGAVAAPGCGTTDTKFEVKTDNSQHPAAQPETGKALVYFVEDDTDFESFPRPTTRLGLDGTWVGANHGNSYFYLSVDPGEHHLCTSWQKFVGFGMGQKSAAAHFTADPGKVYYFRVKNTWLREHGVAHVELLPIDSDEGQLLASKYSYSSFHPRQ